MDSKDDNKKKESANSAENQKANEDFRDIPASFRETKPTRC
ncbi:hypothetical protein [Chryseobacterium indoltheticum]